MEALRRVPALISKVGRNSFPYLGNVGIHLQGRLNPPGTPVNLMEELAVLVVFCIDDTKHCLQESCIRDLFFRQCPEVKDHRQISDAVRLNRMTDTSDVACFSLLVIDRSCLLRDIADFQKPESSPESPAGSAPPGTRAALLYPLQAFPLLPGSGFFYSPGSLFLTFPVCLRHPFSTDHHNRSVGIVKQILLNQIFII